MCYFIFKKIISMFYSRGFVRVRFVNYSPCIASALSLYVLYILLPFLEPCEG